MNGVFSIIILQSIIFIITHRQNVDAIFENEINQFEIIILLMLGYNKI